MQQKVYLSADAKHLVRPLIEVALVRAGDENPALKLTRYFEELPEEKRALFREPVPSVTSENVSLYHSGSSDLIARVDPNTLLNDESEGGDNETRNEVCACTSFFVRAIPQELIVTREHDGFLFGFTHHERQDIHHCEWPPGWSRP